MMVTNMHIRKSTRLFKPVSGFTLIELMIVVSILSILVSIGIPSYHQHTVKTQIKQALIYSDQLKQSVSEFYRVNQRLPSSNKEAGLPEPQYLISNYVTSVEVNNGALQIQLGNKINQKLAGKVLTLHPFTVNDSVKSPIAWGCGYSKAPQGMSKKGSSRTDIAHYYLPIQCRI